MTISIGLSSVVVAVSLVAATACGPSQSAKRRADSAVAAATKAHVVKDAGEVIGARREAQTFFDSARASFILKHRPAASKSLREAATFTRQQSDSASGLDKDALVKSAKELDCLATGIASGTVRSVNTLDDAIARAQLAEAQYHYTRMLWSWNRHHAGAAGAELTMSIDHFDRGVSDAGLHLDTMTQSTLAEVRALTGEMTKGAILNPAEVEKTLSMFDNELQRVTTIVSNQK